MGCDEIVAEDLTVTGSIGVVTAKFNAGELNARIGKPTYRKPVASSEFGTAPFNGHILFFILLNIALGGY